MSRLIETVYREHHQTRERYEFVFGGKIRANLITGFVGKGKRVLDLGCRDGSLTRFYTVGNEVCGIDIDFNALIMCRNNLQIPTLQCDLNEGLPFKDATFDTVVAGEILEHVIYPWMLIREIRRVLKKEGLLIGSVPNSYHWRKRFRFLLGLDLDEDPTHLHFFSYQKLFRLLKEEKFSDIKVFPWSNSQKTLKRLLIKKFPSIFATGFVFIAWKVE
ncbi:MAG: class I SAM-dependent methyltransferase [Armatimonadetes bacterium]|nr:class I SAM-dependent methyltransferase [Armatimonadota bacterium]